MTTLLTTLMKRRYVLLILVVFLASAGPGRIGLPKYAEGDSVQFVPNRAMLTPNLLAQPESTTRAKAYDAYGQLPLSFEVNEGRADSRVKFIARASGQTVCLTSNEAVLTLGHAERIEVPDKKRLLADPFAERFSTPEHHVESKTTELRMRLVGANPRVTVTGLDELPGKSNYFIGNDPAKWRTNVATYAKLKYEQVYPGVDLIYYGNHRQLEYDLIVAPGADAHTVRLGFEGTQNIRVDQSGELIINTSAGEIRQHKPFAYQSLDSGEKRVEARFVLDQANEVSFEIGDYDVQKPLVIDPVIVYSTLLGGRERDGASAIAVDAFGYIYVAGVTSSPDFPVMGPPISNSVYDSVFISKFDPTGKHVVYSTYLSGVYNYDALTSIALDAPGNLYATGWTTSSAFPTTPGAYQTAYKGGDFDNLYGGDGFILKLNASGDKLLYSTLLGGSLADNFRSIAVDSQGNAYVAGYSWSIDFPSTPGAYQTVNHASPYFYPYYANPQEDCFVAKINPSGTALLFSTFIGGTYGEFVGDMKLDSANNVVLVGSTGSDDYPTTPGAYSGRPGVFVTKLNSAGSALISSTEVGPGSGMGVALDKQGDVYITGYGSSGYPTTPGVFQPEISPLNDGTVDAFITKLDPGLSRLVYSTFLGGGGHDFGLKIGVDSRGDAFVTGDATWGFPITPDAFQPQYGGGLGGSPYAGGLSDAFLTKINPTATALLYSTYLGGAYGPSDYGIDEGRALALDSLGNAYIAGVTFSPTFPTTPGAFRTTHPIYDIDGFFAKFEFVQFNLCIQDESNGGILQVNTSTGDYQFISCGVVTLGGTALVTRKGCLITLQTNATNLRLLAKIDTCQKTGTATIQYLTQGRTFTILDRNTANNSCQCSG